MQDPSKLILIPNINVKSPVPAVKFLGIFIDPALNFKYHIEKMTRKLATALFFMRNAKNFLNMEALRSLYYSIFHSVIVYGIHVWSSTANSNLHGIILKQKAAVRTICGSRYNDHTEPLFKLQKILPIEYLLDFFALQFMQHYQQGFLPSIFDDTWPPASLRRDEDFHMNLRNNDDLAVPFARLNLTERQPLTHFPKVWLNFQNENIKFIRNKLEFKKKLKEHFLSQLKDLVICDRLLCPQCHPLIDCEIVLSCFSYPYQILIKLKFFISKLLNINLFCVLGLSISVLSTYCPGISPSPVRLYPVNLLRHP
jgi:hypothetical protein